jgi:hypothetical protein
MHVLDKQQIAGLVDVNITNLGVCASILLVDEGLYGVCEYNTREQSMHATLK